MRKGVVRGNGCTCDACHVTLTPDEAIKIKAYVKDKEWSTGIYTTFEVCDICLDCYKEKFDGFMRKPRKR